MVREEERRMGEKQRNRDKGRGRQREREIKRNQ
jgi:hypothetical protein